ncbi:MAG: HIT family protein [Acidobacteria bacterium]|nr:HIT family protein [Acidobacteriota bacterium]
MARRESTAKVDCPFCKIALGEVPANIVFEDEVSVAFLDHRPLFPGHCLFIPKIHYPTLADIPAGLISAFFFNARFLVLAVEQGMEAEGTFVAINNRVSQSVPHLHVHIVPRHKKDGLRGFFWPRQRYQSEEAMGQVQKAIRSAIARLSSEREKNG